MTKFQTVEPEYRPLRAFSEADSWVDIAAAAVDLIEKAKQRLYISGHSDYLKALAEVIQRADGRTLRIDLLCFGEPPIMIRHGSVIRHSSTDHTVYRHHQARHLAITCDGDPALWALAPEGNNRQAIWSEDDSLLNALVKGFIRHDTFVQRVFADFSDDITARYGLGLERLFTPNTLKVGGRDTDTASADIARPA